jgi:glyoxylase-like metal-dependent hydrolase (beta-lactamase superfamily II)
MRVSRLLAHNPGPYTGEGTNTYLLPGHVPTLVDCGTGEARHLDEVAEALAGSGHDPSALATVLVTHTHTDHASGAAAIANRWPDTVFRKLPWPERDARWAVPWQPVRDGELIAAGDVTLWAMHTPGHSPDHVCFFEPQSGTLFGGDLAVNGGTVFIPASAGGSLAQYLASLERILDLRPRRILAGHGPPIEQPAALLRGYIAHRMARERQIVEALSEGPLSAGDIAARVYAGLDAAVLDAAVDGVTAHLVKLRDEGRVEQEGDDSHGVRWRRSGP